MGSTVEINLAPPPTLGQDNQFISTELLGQSQQHYDYMVENKILSEKLEIPAKEVDVSRDQKVSDRTIHKYDPNFENRIRDEFMVGNDDL